MAKFARKINEGIKARRAAWNATGPVNGMHCPKPGSQNRKKAGFGKRSARR